MNSNINASFADIGDGNNLKAVSKAAKSHIHHNSLRRLRHSERQHIDQELDLRQEPMVWAFDTEEIA